MLKYILVINRSREDIFQQTFDNILLFLHKSIDCLHKSSVSARRSLQVPTAYALCLYIYTTGLSGVRTHAGFDGSD